MSTWISSVAGSSRNSPASRTTRSDRRSARRWRSEVGAAPRLVGRIGAVAADETERQRIRHVEAAHAVGRGDHRDAERGERGQLRPASDSVTPWPMKSTGRSAARIRSSAASRPRATRRRAGCAAARRRHLDVVLFLENVERTSRFTGPGRPVSMVVIAWRSASGSMSTRVGWKLRLTTGRSTLGKSAWCAG